MPAPLKLLVDDTEAVAMLGDWETILSNSSVGGSMQYAGSVGSSMMLEFSGTAISFFGPVNTSSVSPHIGNITIDGQTVDLSTLHFVQNIPRLATTEDTTWYQSDTLSDGAHKISFNNLKFVFFDYAVVTPGSNTNLAGQDIIYDEPGGFDSLGGEADGSRIIVYEPGESWSQFIGETMIVNRTITFSPFGNSTHKTRDPGSSATLSFSRASAVSVFGQYIPTANGDNRSTGSMAVRYILDGVTTELSYAATTIPAINFLLFSNNSIDDGDHILSIQLVNTSDSDLALDYVVYHITGTRSTAPPFPPADDPRDIDIIIGSITAVVVVIVALTVIVICRKKRRKYLSHLPPTGPTSVGKMVHLS
ncbi:hypothetical protein DXG01_008375 [Tephrocybe rancida]|nr:hypothetical protein DXG01_008375 [Tephrocybe rancida]